MSELFALQPALRPTPISLTDTRSSCLVLHRLSFRNPSSNLLAQTQTTHADELLPTSFVVLSSSLREPSRSGPLASLSFQSQTPAACPRSPSRSPGITPLPVFSPSFRLSSPNLGISDFSSLRRIMTHALICIQSSASLCLLPHPSSLREARMYPL